MNKIIVKLNITALFLTISILNMDESHAANKCRELFSSKPLSSVMTKNSSPSQKMADFRFKQFIHSTSEKGLMEIVKNGALLSAREQKMRSGKAHKAWSGSPDDMIFMAASPLDYNRNYFLNQRRYTGEMNEVRVLVPLKYVEHKNFSHYSLGWKYGEKTPGRSFDQRSFANGLAQLSQGRESNEFVFFGSLDFDLNEIRIVVSPKARSRIVKKLQEINPSIDWESKVLRMEDYIQDPLKISNEQFLTLSGGDSALLDILRQDPARALEVAKYVLSNENKLNVVGNQTVIQQVSLEVLLSNGIESALNFLGKKGRATLNLKKIEDAYVHGIPFEYAPLDLARLRTEVDTLYAKADAELKADLRFAANKNDQMDLLASEIYGQEFSPIISSKLMSLMKGLHSRPHAEAVLTVATNLEGIFYITRFLSLVDKTQVHFLASNLVIAFKKIPSPNGALNSEQAARYKYIQETLDKYMSSVSANVQ